MVASGGTRKSVVPLKHIRVIHHRLSIPTDHLLRVKAGECQEHKRAKQKKSSAYT